MDKKILVCLFGVLGRSIKYTWSSIKLNIIDPLVIDGYDVHILILNNNINKNKIDGINIDNNNSKLIVPYNFYKEYNQIEIDNLVNEEYKKKFKEKDIVLSRQFRICNNNMRLLYLESKLSDILKSMDSLKDYDYIVVSNCDYYYTTKFNIKELDNIEDNCILTCRQADHHGITDGFYVGKQTVIINILNRITSIDKSMKVAENYEQFLKNSFIKFNIKRLKSKMHFVKIRADLSIYPSNPWKHNKGILNKFINHINKYDRQLLNKITEKIRNYYKTAGRRCQDPNTFDYMILNLNSVADDV